MNNPRIKTLALALLFAATVLFLAKAQAAQAPTRPEYVSQLESICKPDAEATQRAVAGVTADIRAERLRLAASKFSKAERIFAGTVAEISPIPRPLTDQPRLGRWFTYLGQERASLGRVAAALRAGDTKASQRETAHFVHNGNLANNAVLPFGFNYCLFKLARFT